MSSQTLSYVYCDGKDCPRNGEPLTATPHPTWDVEDNREIAAAEGWYTNKHEDVDICPQCRVKKKEGMTCLNTQM